MKFCSRQTPHGRMPVSYTHLDVYKRQGKCRTDCSVFHFVHHSHLPTQSRRYLALLNLIFIILQIFLFSKIFFSICLSVFLGNQADEHISGCLLYTSKATLETTAKGGVRQSIRNCLTVFQLSLIHISYCYTGSQTYFTPKGKEVIRMKFQKKCAEELLPKMAR